MRKSKHFLLLHVLISLIGCSSLSNPDLSYEERLADKISEQTSRQLKTEKKLFLAGTGGRIRDKVISLALIFEYFQIVNLEEARNLIVYAAETFLKNINENQEIRPYLENDPFTAQNIYVEIWIRQLNGDRAPKEKMNLVTLSRGRIIYELGRPSELEPMVILKEEPYEEALQMVHSEQTDQKAAVPARKV